MDTLNLKKEWESDKPFALCSYLKEQLPDCYDNPYSFWTDLVQNVLPPLKSRLFDSYHVYDDCITRHFACQSIALKILGAEEQTWTYKELDTLVEKVLPVIEGLGPEIALPSTHSLDFLIIFLGTLRLGKAITFTDACVELPTEEAEVPEKIESAVYQPEDPLFTRQGYTLDANTAFLCALRDAIFHLHLERGMTYARPLSSVLDDEPAATLAALLAGATLVYTPNIEQIMDCDIDILGISPPLQKKWLKAPNCPRNKLKFWYKNPLHGTIHETPDFVLLNKLEKIPAAHLLFDPLRGGITLASRPHDPHNILHPNFGIPFSLLQLNGSGEEAIDGIGYFHLLPPRQDTLIVSSLKEGYWISTSTLPLKEGRPYLVEQVEAAATTHPQIDAAIVSTTRDPRDVYGHLFTLVLFVAPDIKTPDVTPLLPPEYMPDQIVTIPLYPRKIKGAFNRELTLSEFNSGNLYRKQKLPLYHLLNRLKHSVRETLC